MRRLLAIVALVCMPALAAEVAEERLERQMLEIAAQLRCAVCQNQPVSESQAELARDMRAIIREQLAAGKSGDEIIAYFVARYGDYVLLKPPMDRVGAAVWLLPPALLVVITVFVALFLRRRLRRTVPLAPELDEEDRIRVRAARARQR